MLRQNSLWLICGIHAGWNWGLGNVFGISVSGLPPHTSAVVYLQPAAGAPDWLTGGTFGTEGSLVAALMIVTATALVATTYWRRPGAHEAGTPAAPTTAADAVRPTPPAPAS